MNVATRKIEIRVDESDPELKSIGYQTLRDISYNTYRYANEIVQLQFFNDILKRGVGNSDNSLSPKEISEKVSELYGCSEMNTSYKFITGTFKDKLPSYVRAALNSVIYKNYKSDLKDVLGGKRSIRTYKNGIPVPFTKQALVKLANASDGEYGFQMFTIPIKTRLGRDRSNNAFILESIVNGSFIMADSSFQFKDGKLFLYLVFKSPISKFELSDDKTLGIDLGLNIPLYAAVNGCDSNLSMGDRDDFLNKRLAFQKRRRSLQSALTTTAGGRGRGKKLKALDRLADSERNFAKNYNHNLSKSVVDYALKQQCGTINIEDLSTIKDRTNTFVLRNWSYYELQNLIKIKAKKVGINVNVVNAAYSSQRCSDCGHISPDNRVTQKDFNCVKCGFKINADHNAAKNISIAHEKQYIDEVKKFKLVK
jgi:IS605 OrfB family transposase